MYTDDGQVASETDILDALQQVVKVTSSSNEPVGFLTTESRDVWGSAYQKLKKGDIISNFLNSIHCFIIILKIISDPTNNASLEAIQDAILVLCLDKHCRIENNLTPYSKMGAQVLHGAGSENNSGNRWFDKTLQVSLNGKGCIDDYNDKFCNFADYCWCRWSGWHQLRTCSR